MSWPTQLLNWLLFRADFGEENWKICGGNGDGDGDLSFQDVSSIPSPGLRVSKSSCLLPAGFGLAAEAVIHCSAKKGNVEEATRWAVLSSWPMLMVMVVVRRASPIRKGNLLLFVSYSLLWSLWHHYRKRERERKVPHPQTFSICHRLFFHRSGGLNGCLPTMCGVTTWLTRRWSMPAPSGVMHLGPWSGCNASWTFGSSRMCHSCSMASWHGLQRLAEDQWDIVRPLAASWLSRP